MTLIVFEFHSKVAMQQFSYLKSNGCSYVYVAILMAYSIKVVALLASMDVHNMVAANNHLTLLQLS